MHVSRGDIWLANLGQPFGVEAGFVRPVVVVQSDMLNRSRLASYVAIPLTANAARAAARWNLLLPGKLTGLEKDSVAQTNLIVTVPEPHLIERIGSVDGNLLDRLLEKLDIALGRAWE